MKRKDEGRVVLEEVGSWAKTYFLRYQICFQSSSMTQAIDQLIDVKARQTLSLSTQLAKSKAHRKKRRAISSAASSSSEEEGGSHAHGTHHKKKYLAKSVNLSFNHF